MLFTHKDDPSIVFETSDIDIEFYPQGGGPSYRMKLSEFLATAAFYTPPDVAKRIRVGFDEMADDEYIDAYSFGQRWNGWAYPYFTREQLDKVLAVNDELRFEDDKVIQPTQYEGEPDDVWEKETIKTVDGEKEVWPVGAGFWCWNVGDER